MMFDIIIWSQSFGLSSCQVTGYILAAFPSLSMSVTAVPEFKQRLLEFLSQERRRTHRTEQPLTPTARLVHTDLKSDKSCCMLQVLVCFVWSWVKKSTCWRKAQKLKSEMIQQWLSEPRHLDFFLFFFFLLKPEEHNALTAIQTQHFGVWMTPKRTHISSQGQQVQLWWKVIVNTNLFSESLKTSSSFKTNEGCDWFPLNYVFLYSRVLRERSQ